MSVNPNNYSADQLRMWLSKLQLATSGTKTVMAERLNNVPEETRGQFEPELDGDENFHNAEGANDLQAREIDLLKREAEILRRENSLLKQLSQLETNNVSSDVTQCIPINNLKDMVPEFNGESSCEFWAKQIKSVGKLYKLNENMMRVLVVSRITGKALKWLHDNVDLANISVDELIAKMENCFGCKESRLVLRRRFEERIWQVGETFTNYFGDKCMLSDSLQMDEGELVDYILEGIPNQQLKMQAYMQCFKTKAHLLQAFSKVELKRDWRPKQQQQQQQVMDKKNIRCFNCNALGHLASECRKPKREYGSCYGCGDKSHRVADCPDRKSTVAYVESNDYVRILKFVFCNNNVNEAISLATLIDTGSPISFVKKRHVPKDINLNLLNNCEENLFYGLNKTKLISFGKISCVIFLESFEINMNILVVADESMSCNVVLGRDFLSLANAKLIFDIEGSNNIVNLNNSNVNENNSIVTKQDYYNSNERKENIVTNYNLETVQKNNVKQGYSQCTYNETVSTCERGREKTHDNNNFHGESSQGFENDIMNINVEPDNEPCVVVGNEIDFNTKNRLLKLFNENYWSVQRPEIPENICEMRIILNHDKPFNCAPRRISYTEKNELQKLIDEYLAKGYIRPSNSEYASPIVLVKKKTGELRLCIDFRNLNKITVKDNYPIPVIDDLLDRLSKKNIFTKLDLKDGFFHVFMSQSSIKLTSFVTPLGQFEFLRMPFGLKNAPSMFQRFVHTVFADMVKAEQVIIYLDDIMVASADMEEHLSILGEVFKRLVKNNLELRLDKCEFLQSSVKYLGYTITGEGIHADGKGLEAIQNFPLPKNEHDVQSFLGMCSYFRRFVRNFSTIAKPLYDLTRKNVKFKFGQTELDCFQLLKNKLLETPVLALYDPSCETELHCDASSIGFGAILFQKKQDKKFHPVFYFSKRTTEIESKYHSFELETLAIVYALKRFRIYLQGKPFKIVTDCNSLTLTLNKKELNPRIARWALELQNFDYVLEHRKNTQMQHVDALSRCTNILIVEANTLEENLVICQGNDSKLKEISENLQNTESKNYEMRNGVIYKKTNDGKILFYVPEMMEQKVMFKYHDEMGHIGVDKVIDLIKKMYWFPLMKEKVTEHIKNCLSCVVFSAKQGKEEGFLNIIPKGNVPFEVIHIDHYGPVDNSVKLKKYILVVVDAFTKFVRLYCTKTTKTKEAIDALIDYFRAYSRPKCIISDRGSCFTSGDFKNFFG